MDHQDLLDLNIDYLSIYIFSKTKSKCFSVTFTLKYSREIHTFEASNLSEIKEMITSYIRRLS